MIERIKILLLASVFIVYTAGKAQALGIGAYIEAGGGQHTHSITTKDHLKVGDEADFANVKGGLIFDTNLNTKKIFNYRLKIGGGSYVMYSRERDLALYQVEMSHTFGFSLVRSKLVRFWIGPSLGGSVSWGSGDSLRRYIGGIKITNFFNYNYTPSIAGLPYYFISIGHNTPTWYFPFYHYGFSQDKIKKVILGGLNIGLVSGLNLNVTKKFVIALEFGFKYDISGGNEDRRIYDPWVAVEYGKFTEKLFVHGWNLYFTLAFMYRYGEK